MVEFHFITNKMDDDNINKVKYYLSFKSSEKKSPPKLRN